MEAQTQTAMAVSSSRSFPSLFLARPSPSSTRSRVKIERWTGWTRKKSPTPAHWRVFPRDTASLHKRTRKKRLSDGYRCFVKSIVYRVSRNNVIIVQVKAHGRHSFLLKHLMLSLSLSPQWLSRPWRVYFAKMNGRALHEPLHVFPAFSLRGTIAVAWIHGRNPDRRGPISRDVLTFPRPCPNQGKDF